MVFLDLASLKDIKSGFLKPKRKHLLQSSRENLLKWADYFLTLEVYYGEDLFKSVSERDYEFLKIIGSSVHQLNLFSSKILKVLNILNKKKRSICLTDYIDYVEFNTDMLTSSIKHFFFKENPNLTHNTPYLSRDRFTLLDGSAIVDLVSELGKINQCNQIEKIGDELKFYLAKFFFSLNFRYSFIYDKDQESGIFLRFEFNKDIFNEICRDFEQKLTLLKSSDDANKNLEVELRLFLDSIFPYLLRKHHLIAHKELNNQNIKPSNQNIFEEDLQNIAAKEIFKEYINAVRKDKNKNKDLYLEPFSWRLGSMLWRISGAIQYMDEYVYLSQKDTKDKENVKNLISKIESYLKFCKNAYCTNRLDYSELFEKERDVAGFFKELLPPKEKDYIRRTLNEIKNMKQAGSISKSTKGNCWELHVTENSPNHKNEFVFYGFPEKQIKLEKLLYNQSIENFNSLILSFLENVDRHVKASHYNEKLGLVGIYTSGVFLAHLYNILFRKKELAVWLFKVYPYVSTHPLHNPEGEDIPKHILVLDESFKTCFTSLIYSTYLLRRITSPVSISAWALVDFEYYKKIKLRKENNIHVNYRSHIQISSQRENKITWPPPSERITKKKFEISINQIDLTALLSTLISATDGTNTLDLTIWLMDSDLVLFIAKRFKEKIEGLLNSTEQTKEVLLFSPCPEGETLKLFTAYLLKLDNPSIKLIDMEEFLGNKENYTKDNLIKVAIDISLDTGYTLASSWLKATNRPLSKRELFNPSKVLKEFDSVLTIVRRNSAGKMEINKFLTN